MEKEVKRVKMIVAYDGTNYKGWQVQPNGVTVQQVLQDAVQRLTGVRSGITGCSRTDAGVHAEMFCCALHTEPHGFRRTFAGKRGNFRYDDAHAGG